MKATQFSPSLLVVRGSSKRIYAALTLLIGIPGGAGSIFVSRQSTSLHAAASVIAPHVVSRGDRKSELSPRLVMLLLFVISIPVGIAFFFILRVSSWLATPFLFTLLALFFLCATVSFVLQMSVIS